MSKIIKNIYKAYHLALSLTRRDKYVGTNTVYLYTPTVECEFKIAQVFVEKKTLVPCVCLLKSAKQFVNNLQDQIMERDAPN